MEPVEVTAHFDLQGQATPLSYVLHGRKYKVASSGRRWQDENGIHILIMAPDERVSELIFVAQKGRWYLKPIPMLSGHV